MFTARKLAFSALMASFMSILIGATLTTTKAGIGPQWWSQFFATFPVAFAVALPVGVFVTPVAERLVTLVFGDDPSSNREGKQ